MKSYNHLYELYAKEDNFRLAFHNATLYKSGKKWKNRKAKWYRDHEDDVKDKVMYYATHFKSDEHKKKLIYDGVRRKQRSIVVPNMREQIVHHMVVNVLKPIFMRSMYEHSYGSIPGRGIHSGKKAIEKWIRKDQDNTKYCLKMDIKKYFDSIPHDILKKKFRVLIHDEKFLKNIFEIINSENDERGIPIGFYTSQWIANWYLTELDHYIKEELKATYYIRYMDDMVIFGNNKEKLHNMHVDIENYLRVWLGIEMKDNWQVFDFDRRDLEFMGFRFYRNKTILRKSLLYRMTRKAKRIDKKKAITVHDCRQMLSYLGLIMHTNTYNSYEKWIKPNINFQYLKRKLSRYDKRRSVCNVV